MIGIVSNSILVIKQKRGHKTSLFLVFSVNKYIVPK